MLAMFATAVVVVTVGVVEFICLVVALGAAIFFSPQMPFQYTIKFLM
jgi:ABC-type Fe3+-siderophore transport system permease subunit